jgi:hypothetical protein
MDFMGELQRELASATVLVWQMQNGLTENVPVERLVEMAEAMAHQAAVVQGHLARWALWNLREQGRG